MTESSPPPPPDERPTPPYGEWIDRFDRLDDQQKAQLRSLITEMSDPPLISILLPVYEPSEQLLREAIDSVVNQIYPHWELCIADDASVSEWIPRVLAQYQASDSRIHVVFRPENGHISAATNSAAGVAHGEFIGFSRSRRHAG